MDKKIKKLIELYESVIHGNNESIGLFNCYDTYYAGCWDDELKEIEELKTELKLYTNGNIRKNIT